MDVMQPFKFEVGHQIVSHQDTLPPSMIVFIVVIYIMVDFFTIWWTFIS